MHPGIYDDISNADYHGGPGISKSGLDLVRRSPLHYKAAREATNDNAPTLAQMIGTAAHALILEPAEFVQNYTLALRRSDVPDAIEDRDVLVGMVQELNKGRLAKLSTSGSKEELAWRVIEALGPFAEAEQEAIKAEKIPELKSRITQANESRPGLLTTTGNRHELADILRAHGRTVTLWSDVEAEWRANNGHRTVLTPEQWTQVHGMRNAVMEHPAARSLLEAPGHAELSVYWRDPATSVLCRCRPDFWRQDGIVVDLKTTEDASPEAFARSMANYRYHVQHAMYVDGIEAVRNQAGRSDIAPPKAFVFIAVEKKPPYAVAVYVLDNESIALGRAEYRSDLVRYAECERSGIFPGYGHKIDSISLPKWLLANNAHLIEQAA